MTFELFQERFLKWTEETIEAKQDNGFPYVRLQEKHDYKTRYSLSMP